MVTTLAAHLEDLVGGSEDSADRGRRLLDEWGSVPKNTGRATSDPEELDENIRWASVVDVFVQGSSSDGNVRDQGALLSDILSKPALEPLLETLLSLLISSRSDDDISGELAELVGFDNIDLSSSLISSRKEAAQQISEYLHTPADAIPTGAQVSGRRKGKHVEGNTSAIQVLDPEEARRRMEDALRANAARPLFTGTAHDAPEILPHVYTSSSITQGNMLSHTGQRYMLPLGTTRNHFEDWEEVTIPPARMVPPRVSERLIPVAELDPLARKSFPGYASLNRIQSIVFPTAYKSNENMLVCAPTGAGKTDVAMLTVLRVIDQYMDRSANPSNLAATIHRDQFKIIYVAPMKALAAEIVRKLGKRLKWLNISVRELTGDMQLTKQEINETQIIVTTPEKWDVVTRKPTGEGELASRVKLLIIDEVHLLNDDRGAVIETIVARTLRQVNLCTLPNYVDVADFLSVNKQRGLFYFDSSFRPVPLEQHFIGVKGKPNSTPSKRNLDRVTFEKVKDMVLEGHQVMVFVHARKETVKAAEALKEAAQADGNLDYFSCQEHPQYDFFRRDIGKSRNKEMKQLFDLGFGIHHAGMLREDRNMMERMFDARAIKVLCCTATLAWGVNLPAHAVVIKGTQVYDSAKGAFTDLSVLDVLQVLGRAGRPGLETSGVGFICTTEDKLNHYLDAVMSQVPIESRFVTGIIDSLNAEIALNPFQYGIGWDEIQNDPQLQAKRRQLITAAARQLAEVRMIAFDQAAASMFITDLGRIAAKYYIRYKSIEIFINRFKPKMSEADVLAMLSESTEFEQVKYRPDDFALVSDQAYAAQNGGRIIRALLEIAISRKWANVSAVLMGLSKAIEKRLWPFDHPLKQFQLKRRRYDYAVSELAEMSAEDIGKLIHLNAIQGAAIQNVAKEFPTARITYSLRPLGPDVLKIVVKVEPTFKWNSRQHGSVEPFWLWVEDHDGANILQLSHLIFRQTTTCIDVDFVISVPEKKLPLSVTIRYVSDRWMGAEEEVTVPLEDLVMPSSSESHTPRLDIPFLPLSVVQNPALQTVLSQRMHGSLNAIQSQVFWSIVRSRQHALLCAPTGCGKSIIGQVAIWETLKTSSSNSWALVIVPHRSIAYDILSEMRPASKAADASVELSTTGVFDFSNRRTVRIITASDLLAVLSRRPEMKKSLMQLRVVLCESLEFLDDVYELVVSLLLHATQPHPVRFIGLSSSLNDPADLAAWLNVDPLALHAFRPSDRDQALSTATLTFTIPQSTALLKAMAKPAHAAIHDAEPALVFVPSRAQCASVARDLLTQCALATASNGFLPRDADAARLADVLRRVRDRELADLLARGVGLWHDGLVRPDRLLALELYAEGLVRVLVVPRDAAGALPVRGATVVVLGTQYVHAPAGADTERQLREYPLQEVVRMQGKAVRHDGRGRFFLFCQAEGKDTVTRFLDDGLPLESRLLETDALRRWWKDRRADGGGVADKQAAVDVLSFTFLARRLVSNPAYYDARSTAVNDLLSRIVDDLDK
ncbi:Sec63-domain-containing protein [Epithele typhae]|uniref:Sec63-domain-containing protein n=1 Tax=Epithele typhae TaxID=378194 RepID=UPI002007B5D1|nr:Sec63-domain-containing protein [Epithele typhae]KAH9943329.1 Sec63-domain-containing protein [Epithele typhae]